jgi:hypothetical protein
MSWRDAFHDGADEAAVVIDGLFGRRNPRHHARDYHIALCQSPTLGGGSRRLPPSPSTPGTYVPVEEPSTASIAEVATLPGHQQLL